VVLTGFDQGSEFVYYIAHAAAFHVSEVEEKVNGCSSVVDGLATFKGFGGNGTLAEGKTDCSAYLSVRAGELLSTEFDCRGRYSDGSKMVLFGFPAKLGEISISNIWAQEKEIKLLGQGCHV